MYCFTLSVYLLFLMFISAWKSLVYNGSRRSIARYSSYGDRDRDRDRGDRGPRVERIEPPRDFSGSPDPRYTKRDVAPSPGARTGSRSSGSSSSSRYSSSPSPSREEGGDRRWSSPSPSSSSSSSSSSSPYSRSSSYGEDRGDRDRGGDRNRGERDRDRGGDRRPSSNYGDYAKTYQKYDREDKTEPEYGYYDGDHLYGVSTVRLALMANKRKMSELLVQTGLDLSNKKDSKAAADILRLAKQLGLAVREFPKHDLNMLSDNRPHQGFVLRAETLDFKRISTLEPSASPKCVLALDEVWDPQNFGALLRTCHFLGVEKVIVCSKNSAPLSPTVSKASAGAMELMDNVYSTDNMMKFLDRAQENGWQVVGTALTSASIPLQQVPLDKPTVLVLGNEGHGIRTNILRRCTHLVKIGGSEDVYGDGDGDGDGDVSEEGEAGGEGAGEGGADGVGEGSGGRESSKGAVDSLNVSVTGGIILHYLLSALKR